MEKDLDMKITPLPDKIYVVKLSQLNGRYSLRITPLQMGEKEKKYWNCLDIEILEEENVIGKYRRNYPSLYDTFYPFEQDGKHYALYSKDYTATRVMSLPDCKDICGEEYEPGGFCPTGYYVPMLEDNIEDYCDEEEMKKDVFGKMGFVCGCVWGDDCSWKIQFLDLSKINESKLVRDDRFGYIELPHNMKLKDAIRFPWFFDESRRVCITTEITFPIDKKTEIDFAGLTYEYHEGKE